MRPCTIDESVLPTGVADVASSLSRWSHSEAFYLSGGTALSLQLGHRQSRDLDFFTRAPLQRLPQLTDLERSIGPNHSFEWVLRTPEQQEFRADGVATTLLAYPFQHRYDFCSWRGLWVADPRDIAIQKAYTIGRRAVARDYLDLHALLCVTQTISLGDLLQAAQIVYGEGFSSRLFLRQLTDDSDLIDHDDAITLLISPYSFEAIMDDLQSLVRDWLNAELGKTAPPDSDDKQ